MRLPHIGVLDGIDSGTAAAAECCSNSGSGSGAVGAMQPCSESDADGFETGRLNFPSEGVLHAGQAPRAAVAPKSADLSCFDDGSTRPGWFTSAKTVAGKCSPHTRCISGRAWANGWATTTSTRSVVEKWAA
eukprot:SAG31_NODE_579_length_13948_cov_5.599105_13_plen_132_part_00